MKLESKPNKTVTSVKPIITVSYYYSNSFYILNGKSTNERGYWIKDIYDEKYSYSIDIDGFNRITSISTELGIRPVLNIKKSLLKVRQYLQNNPEIESVVFEVNNSTVVSWLQNYYSKEAYQDSFVEVIRLLQEIPMQYAFVVNPKPKAMRFADKKFIVKKLVVSSFNLDEFEE
jgi:hypothetical protein